MASRSPQAEDSPQDAQDEYQEAWAALRVLILEQGASWSGNELNCSYFNTGDGRFVNISAISGAEFIDDARSMVPVDWDNDGDLDMVLKNRTAPRVRIMRNDYKSGGHYLAVDLRATVGHPDAIGAQVVLEAGGKTFIRRVYCGDGFLAQRPRRLHFGLGTADKIDKLTVNWTDGSSEVHEAPPVDGLIRITQGQGDIETPSTEPGKRFRLAPSQSVVGIKQPVSRVPLVAKIPMNKFPLPSFEDAGRTVGDLAGRPVLINLWASWCGGCRAELTDFEEHANLIEKSGLQIVPMTTDDPEDYAEATSILGGHGLEGLSGYVDETLMSAFQLVLIEILGQSEGAPLPTSFLLDQAGNLVAVYLGPVDVDVLMKDMRRMKRMTPSIPMEPQMLGGGRWGASPRRKFRLMARGFGLIGYPELERQFMALHENR